MLLVGATVVAHSFSPPVLIPRRRPKTCANNNAREDFPIDDDGRRRRRLRRRSEPAAQESSNNHVVNWGIVHYDSKPRYPHDVESVSLSAWEAVASTLYGKQRMDPNEVNNVRAKSVYGRRPVRREYDRGRIGVEVDGASSLFLPRKITDTSANRQVSFLLAARLAQGPWEDFETEKKPFSRPVAVYFNTIKQSLVASQELGMLKRMYPPSKFESVSVRTLGQDLDIPEHMQRKGKKPRGLSQGEVNPEQGIIMIVQPSDFNEEFRPPGPAVDSVSHFQQLVARAATQNLPVVVVSPRFLTYQSSFANNWEQSGYQQSSVFGGDEPARGPTPWILRDFFPPAFVWADAAVTLSRTTEAEQPFSRVSVMQSVLNEEHAWHIFGARQDRHTVNYQYLASTSTSAGRPTMAIMKYVFHEWS